MPQENSASNALTSKNKKGNKTLKHLLSSEECVEYFKSLSKITGFDLSIYDENGNHILTTKENPICRLFKSELPNFNECPGSCKKPMFEPLRLNEPITYKCYSKVINFSIPLNYLKEKAVLVGRNGFTSYEDFLEFLKIAKKTGLKELPVTTSLNFADVSSTKNTSHYVHKAISYLLYNLQEKHKLTEKLGRFTSLVDVTILEKLSSNTSSIYRYIIDTIEFVLGPTSVAILTLDNQTSTYKTISASGKYKDILIGLSFNSENTLIQKILSTKAPMFQEELIVEKLMTARTAGKPEILHLFPIFIANSIKALIGVLGRKIPGEDIKIINALRDYIQVTLENRALHLAIEKKQDEILTSIYNSSKSIAPLLNWEQLLQTILEKSTQLLKAEKGSLMLLNKETSELLVEAKKSIDGVAKENMKLRPGEKIAGRVLESGESLLVKDVEKDPRINRKNKNRYKTKSFVSVPIKIENRVEGVINISDKITGEVFDENDLKLIQSFVPNAAIAIERGVLYKKIKELKKISLTDPLTGTLNRRYLNSRLAEEISHVSRYKQSFSFLMLDIDGFKNYNDTFGHLTGDRVLKTLAAVMTTSIRNIDILARFGGDEFVIIFPRTPKSEAVNIANRLMENVEKFHITSQKGDQMDNLTVSIGLSSFPDDASSLTELLERTDQALYLAKKGGRNKLVYL